MILATMLLVVGRRAVNARCKQNSNLALIKDARVFRREPSDTNSTRQVKEMDHSLPCTADRDGACALSFSFAGCVCCYLFFSRRVNFKCKENEIHRRQKERASTRASFGRSQAVQLFRDRERT